MPTLSRLHGTGQVAVSQGRAPTIPLLCMPTPSWAHPGLQTSVDTRPSPCPTSGWGFLDHGRSLVRLRGQEDAAPRGTGRGGSAQEKMRLSLAPCSPRPLRGLQSGHLLLVSLLQVRGDSEHACAPLQGARTGLGNLLHQSRALGPPADRQLELGKAESIRFSRL